jgi:hypothetical protein
MESEGGELLETVISGGQVGADIAALRAAVACGLATGGYAPRGWRTAQGPKPELGHIYHLSEHKSTSYPPRTRANVRDSDATIRLALNFDSAGEKCTLKAIHQYQRPYFDVKMRPASRGFAFDAEPQAVAVWLRFHEVRTLNVAGNALPPIEGSVQKFLETVFKLEQRRLVA